MARRVQLAPLLVEDFQLIIDWQRDADFLYQWAGRGYRWPLDLEQYKKRLAEGVNQQWGTDYVYKIQRTKTHEMIGTVELSKIDRVKKNATFSRFLIGPELYRGQGYGRETMALVEEIARKQLQLKKLFLKVFSHNEQALALYKQLGYRQVRVERQAYQGKDGWWEALVMYKDL